MVRELPLQGQGKGVGMSGFPAPCYKLCIVGSERSIFHNLWIKHKSHVMALPIHLELCSIDELAALVTLISTCILRRKKNVHLSKAEQSHNSNLRHRHRRDRFPPRICLPKICEFARDSYTFYHRQPCSTEQTNKPVTMGAKQLGDSVLQNMAPIVQPQEYVLGNPAMHASNESK